MFSLPPNKHRAVLFLGSGLTAVQVGHSALKGMQIAAADLAGGRAVWDVVQCASLDDMEASEGSGSVGFQESRPWLNIKPNTYCGRMARQHSGARLPVSLAEQVCSCMGTGAVAGQGGAAGGSDTAQRQAGARGALRAAGSGAWQVRLLLMVVLLGVRRRASWGVICLAASAASHAVFGHT